MALRQGASEVGQCVSPLGLRYRGSSNGAASNAVLEPDPRVLVQVFTLSPPSSFLRIGQSFRGRQNVTHASTSKNEHWNVCVQIQVRGKLAMRAGSFLFRPTMCLDSVKIECQIGPVATQNLRLQRGFLLRQI